MITRRQQEILNHLRFREAGETDPARQHCWLEPNRFGGYTLIVPCMTGGWAKSPFNIRAETLYALTSLRLVKVDRKATMPQFPKQTWKSGYPVTITREGRALTTNGTNK